ncbi:class A beta-lactamase [Undibacterium sp. Ji50W]|uniref:class A beta-lactamase n=1 Tax=Undibacterium sp. Ji50W TaxID=3413041 RepID=UPI003BEF5137
MKKLFISLMMSISLSLACHGMAAAQNVLEAIAIDSGGKLCASLLVLETGQSLWIFPDAAAPMQNVYKFPIVMAALAAVDQHKLKFDQKVLVTPEDLVGDGQHSPIRDEYPQGNINIPLRKLMRHAIVDSDGTASDVLLRLLGGPVAVMQYLEQLGIQDIKVMDTEKEMGKNWTLQYRNSATPKAMIKLLQIFQQGKGLSPKSRELLMKWMQETDRGAERIKGLLPPETLVAHKTGTSGVRNGFTAAHNDVGIVTLPNGNHMAVVVFLTDSSAPHRSRDLTIAKITRVGWDAWAGK